MYIKASALIVQLSNILGEQGAGKVGNSFFLVKKFLRFHLYFNNSLNI